MSFQMPEFLKFPLFLLLGEYQPGRHPGGETVLVAAAGALLPAQPDHGAPRLRKKFTYRADHA